MPGSYVGVGHARLWDITVDGAGAVACPGSHKQTTWD